MKRAPFLTVALLAAFALTSCGSPASEEATDPAGETSPSASATPTPSTTPTADPTPGAHVFAPTNYTYVLRVFCFCPLAGRPVQVTVQDGAVAEAVWRTNSTVGTKGEPVAEEWLRKTIQDILDEANDPKVDEVDLDWPEGQDYPNKVSLDPVKRAVDDERSYQISQVEVTG